MVRGFFVPAIEFGAETCARPHWRFSELLPEAHHSVTMLGQFHLVPFV
ncbi:MAG: hypothetical protein ACI9OD_000843 [Limisphaerales bacterium]|jgi:hypothetical protein